VTLETYRRKRRFDSTPEPRGGPVTRRPRKSRSVTGRFVIHRHRARRLHYDLRLELGGVLASWAVPRGPTLDAGVKRLAVRVEDHPLEYFDFEGVIPRRQYGAGDVIVWDWGTWTADPSHDDPAEAVRGGELKFRLDGAKLRGRFVLVRTNWRGGSRKEQWLLMHRRDEDAVAGWDPEDHPDSVKSGRTNEQLAAARP
jgi:bifunctional non-homologous end joining protein LigD